MLFTAYCDYCFHCNVSGFVVPSVKLDMTDSQTAVADVA